MKDPYLRCPSCHQRVTAELDDKRHCELIEQLEQSRRKMHDVLLQAKTRLYLVSQIAKRHEQQEIYQLLNDIEDLLDSWKG